MKNLLTVSLPTMGVSPNANDQGLKTNFRALKWGVANLKRPDIRFFLHLHKTDCNFYKTATL